MVGYSRMMGADEAGTLAALKRHRETLFDPTVAANSGRVVKLIGDGTLVEFGSVVDAVNCALAIQTRRARPTATPRITLRIGINLGDIIIDGDDIYGDGVNVAARLEPLAEPGGVCVASIVNESVGSRIDVTLQRRRRGQVKNIDRPIRVWKWHPGNGAGGRSASRPRAAAPKPRATPSIAVLPFNNMSGDPEQEYFSDGISEDIITDLSKVGGLTVIARNSSFAYKGKSRRHPHRRPRARRQARCWKARSARAGNRVRITAQLIDADTGAHLWAERYDRDLTDIFEVQDDVTRTIVDALKVTLTPSEKAAARRATPTDSVEAHDLFLRGARADRRHRTRPRESSSRRSTCSSAPSRSTRTTRDAYAGLALALQSRLTTTAGPTISTRRSRDADELAAQGDRARSRRAVRPLRRGSMTASFMRDFERGQARRSTGRWSSTRTASGAQRARRRWRSSPGNPKTGIPDIERAMRLDPGFGQQYLHFLGLAHLMLGHYETAATMFRERILLVPEDRPDAARSSRRALGHLGDVDEARAGLGAS